MIPRLRIKTLAGSQGLGCRRRDRKTDVTRTGKSENDSPDRRSDIRAAADAGLPAQPRHVGTVLRSTREAQHEDIRVAANHLRIREAYLRAIEEGRFEELPAQAYAVGFVRAYAIHLGLDGDKLVRRFKEETGASERRPDLVIPEPRSESRMPGGALVLASLLLAAGAYGGWYWFTTTGRMADTAAIGAPARPAAQPAAPSTAPPATGGLDTSIVGVAKPIAPYAAAPVLPKSVTPQSVPPQPAPVAAAEKVEGLAAQTAAQGEEETVDATPAPEPLKPLAKAPESVTQPMTQPAAQAARAPDALPRPPVSSASAANAATIDPAMAKIPKSRVTIRAIADSWLQIGDGRSPSIFAQVLRAGDSFAVPERPGLRFDTGNAGGLEIIVDGQPLPPIGPSGSVRRNIALDADKLLAGAGQH